MTAEFFTAEDMAWKEEAACSEVSFNFVPDVETDRGVNRAQQWCRACPVRINCLSWAMLHKAEGYWGGTTTHQRKQLRRVRTRLKCPLCLSNQLVYTNPHELCLACGASWVRDVRRDPITARLIPLTTKAPG